MRLTVAEVAKHDTRESCWMVIHGQVYDVTEFLPEHPGGTAVMLRFAGRDATEEYDPVHPAGTIEKELPKEKHLGALEPSDPATASSSESSSPSDQAQAPVKTPSLNSVVPALPLILSLDDFEEAARRKLTGRAWIYYSSGSESMRSYARNLADWSKVSLRPRVLRDVQQLDTSRTILGHHSNLPIFIAPCALGRLGHPDGEFCLVKGAARFNIPYAVSMGSSIAPEELTRCQREEEDAHGGGCLVFQLYVKKDPNEVRATVRRARSLGFRALMVTVDTPVVGKREEDDRFKASQGSGGAPTTTILYSQATSSAVPARAPYSVSLNWDDLAWIVKEWGDAGPVCLKGICTFEDARQAADLGFTSLYLSNHGGRQLDGAPSGLHVLMEIRRYCPDVLQRCEILVDGGVRRGTDVLKALALGATAVGIGRPFMYALSTHGTDGVCRALEILTDEIQTNMRLLGVTRCEELGPRAVNTHILEQEITTDLAENYTPNTLGGRQWARM
ncbi:hypothetical protein AJ80_07901 [Polytolypa hystricis UAMH7299]|uniref:L-lactate dehydrogenase (Cytochrome) n=1 Tax=Polytolypa hystricis (strain UAMH7299) TaxID=1447883 RepID=A0A2B7XHA6_POLH7|nr:hypothetical protein AJ80_07901 [Polytolypa hystricis UAMH7299]